MTTAQGFRPFGARGEQRFGVIGGDVGDVDDACGGQGPCP
jgi:hypothetical protein